MFKTGFARCPIDGDPVQALKDDPLEGSTFADRYVIEKCIGEGGMGRVYRARHQRVSRQFAIKVLYGEHATDEKMRERFAREAEAASRLDHPNVISVIDFGETEQGLLYLVMDFVEGRELDEIITVEGALERTRIVTLLRQLCEGLAHAHKEDLVHRDFKGNNVLVTDRDGVERARIVDFGLAILTQGFDERITTDGVVFGTPSYMSPEQATGGKVDHLTDLFALGVVLYEMLAGVRPFEGTPLSVARKNISSPPPPIAERVPGLDVDPALEAMSFRLMAKRAEDRYQSAEEVLTALDALSDAKNWSPVATASTEKHQTEPPPFVPMDEHDDDDDEPPGARFEQTDSLAMATHIVRERRRPLAIALIALLALILSGIGIAVLLRGDGAPATQASLKALGPDASIVASDGEVTPAVVKIDETGITTGLEPVGAGESSSAPISDTANVKETAPIAEQTKTNVKAPPTKSETKTETKTETKVTDEKAPVIKEKSADDVAAKPVVPDEPDEPDEPTITQSSLAAFYSRVGAAVEAYEVAHPTEGAPIRRAYERILLSDALMKPPLRKEAWAALKRIDRQLKKAKQ